MEQVSGYELREIDSMQSKNLFIFKKAISFKSKNNLKFQKLQNQNFFEIKTVPNLLKIFQNNSKINPSYPFFQLVTSIDSRVSRLEKQLEMALNSIYTLVQLQTGINSQLSRFKEETNDQLKTIAQELGQQKSEM